MGTAVNYITQPLREIGIRWICKVLWYLFSAISSCCEETHEVAKMWAESSDNGPLISPSHLEPVCCAQCCPLEVHQITEDCGVPLLLQTCAWLVFVLQSGVQCHSLLFCTLLLFQILVRQFWEEEKRKLSPRWCPRATAHFHLCSSPLSGQLTTFIQVNFLTFCM